MNAGSADCINAVVGSNLEATGFQNQKADSILVNGCDWRSRWILGRDSLNVQRGESEAWMGRANGQVERFSRNNCESWFVFTDGTAMRTFL
jgi:hypothetical protein